MTPRVRDSNEFAIEADWDLTWSGGTPRRDWFEAEARSCRWTVQERLTRSTLGPLSGLSVIEIGAGRGTAAALYARQGATVTLLDQSELVLSQARELFAANSLAVRTVVGDVFDLPSDLREKFDVSLSFGLCEHFTGARRLACLRAHFELLRPHGLAFIGVPNRWAPVYRLWMARLRSRGKWLYGTEIPFTAGELRRLAREAGAIPLDVSYGSFVASLFEQGINPLLTRLQRSPVYVRGAKMRLIDLGAYDIMLAAQRPGSARYPI